MPKIFSSWTGLVLILEMLRDIKIVVDRFIISGSNYMQWNLHQVFYFEIRVTFSCITELIV